MIVDASVAFKWIIAEPDSDAATALIGREDLRAPSIVFAEVGHGISKRIRRGELKAEGVIERLQRLPALLSTDDAEADLASAMTLALQFQHSFYDCLYLALAQRLDDVLVTADEVFVRKFGTTGDLPRIVMLSDTMREGNGP
jgi:predicted nucleic acid-binding protein